MAPTAATASGPAPGTYENATNKNLDITLVFNEPVTVVTTGGTPSIPLTIGGAVRQATYSSGTGTNTIVFRYVIASPTDVFASGTFTVGSTVSLNGGTIKDAAGNDYALTVPAVTVAGVNINSQAVLTKLQLSSANDKFYRTGESIEFTATFDAPVSVSGPTPSLALTIGTASRSAGYVSGGDTATLTFRYTVQAGDNDADGIELPNGAIVLNGGAITRGGAPAILTFTPPILSGVRVDTTTPTILNPVVAPSDGTYVEGQTLQFVVPFSKSMSVTSVTGWPRIAMVIGSAARFATYVAGAGTPMLVFEYVVAAGDNDSNGIVTATSISLNGATITDSASNPATLTFTPVNTSRVNVDTLAPTVTRFISSTPNGSYGVGAAITVNAVMSEVVAAGSEMIVTFDTGAVATLRAAIQGNALTGIYTVGAGETSSDLNVTSFKNLSVLDLVNNALADSTPATMPTGTNNIAGSKAIVIDTTAPVAPTLALASDTGSSPSDGVTRDGTVNVSGIETGALWQYSLNGGTNWVSGVGSSFVLPVGSYAAGIVRARQTDITGNNSPAGSLAIVITVDTSASAPTLALANDTGSSGLDGITKDGTVNVGGLEAGASWQYSINGGGTWATGTGSSFTLAVGTYAAGALQAQQTDLAGNTSPIGSSNAAITVDSTAPAAPTFSLANDTGSSGSDGVTTDGTVNVGGIETGASWQFSTNSGGTWTNGTGTSFTLPSGTYTAGVVQVRQIDLAGNTSSPGSNASAITVDATAPAAPTFALTSDTGSSSVDGITNVGTVIVSGLESGASWQFSTNSGATWTNGTGTSFTLAAGTYAAGVVQVRQIDLAGNTGPARSNAATIIVDTSAPAAPALSLANDTGSSNSDGVTSNGNVNVTGLETGATWQYSTDSGANWINGTGTSFALPAGSYAIGVVQVRQIDLAGNTSSPGSNASAITVDATAPAAPTFALTSDTGSSSVDGITNVGTVIVSGLESGASWQFSTNSGATWTNGTGTSFTLAAGTYAAGVVQVRQIDLAGNTGPARSNAATIIVDVIAPAIVSFSTTSANGTYSTNGIVLLTAVMSESVQAGGSMSVRLNTGSEVTLTASASGTTLTGSYVVQPGEVTVDLDIDAILLTPNGVRDIAGNPLVSTAIPSPRFRDVYAIVIDASVKFVAPAGFSTNSQVIPDKKVAVTAVPITFSAPVTGVTLAAFKLLYNGRSIKLAGTGATVIGSGSNYTLRIPSRLTNLKGIYTLQIDPSSIRAASNGAPMIGTSTLYWGKGASVGMTPARLR